MVKTKKNKLHKNKTQKAGVRISQEYTQKTAIEYFIKNSTFTYFSKGYYGVLVLSKLNENVISPYINIRTNGVERVNQILFKFYDFGTPERPTGNTVEKIMKELNIQSDIYRKSIAHPNTLLEPICPGIVFAQIHPIQDPLKTIFLRLMMRTINNEKKHIIENMFNNDIAFIAMECMDGYEPLISLEESPKYRWYNTMALYILDKLHIIGYKHMDYTKYNVLINTKNNYFYAGSGQAIIIDFGESTQISNNEKNDRARLLRREEPMSVDDANNCMLIFEKLDSKREDYQRKIISDMEYSLGGINIVDIINTYNFYTYRQNGGKSLVPIKLSRSLKYKKMDNDESQINKYTEKKTDFFSIDELEQHLSDQFRKDFELIDPIGYKKYIDGINSTREQENKTPGYINKLIKSQLYNMIDPDWK